MNGGQLYCMLDARRRGTYRPNEMRKAQVQGLLPHLIRKASLYKLDETISYSIVHLCDDRLLVGDETGFLHVLKEPKAFSGARFDPQNPSSMTQRVSFFQCANRSVFDMGTCADNKSRVYVASSDGIVYHADIEQGGGTMLDKHQLSENSSGLKCVKERPAAPGQILTSSRDGSISFIDVRIDNRKVHQSANFTMPSMHRPNIQEPPRKKRRRSILRSGLCETVSAVAWLSDIHFASSGVSDGKLKIWDMRKWPSIQCSPVMEMIVGPRPNTTKVGWGISWLDYKAGHILAAVPRSGLIKVYKTHGFMYDSLLPEPVAQLQCYIDDSFYFRPKFSHDAELVAGGNDERMVNIWKVQKGEKQPRPADKKLEGHKGEVTMVSWNSCYDISSTGDDGVVYSWSMQR